MANIAFSIWTTERVEQLKGLWSRNDCSAGVIAGIMNITRNAVLGKAHRLNLEERSPRSGEFYRPQHERTALLPKRRAARSVFQSREIKPRLRVQNPKKKPALMAVVSPITGSFITARRRPFAQRDYTKNELRAMLTAAIVNTAALEIIA